MRLIPTRWAIRISFALAALTIGLTSVRIVEIKSEAGLSNTGLSLLFLTSVISVMAALLFAPKLARYIKLVHMIAIGITGMALGFTFLSIIPPYGFMLLCEILFGISAGLFEVGANTVAQNIDRNDRPIMSSVHGFWSIGMMLGSFIAGILAEFGLSFLTQQVFLAPLIILFAWMIIPVLPHPKIAPEDEGYALPNLTILPFCLIPFAALYNEGAIADWSSVFLEEERNFNPFYIGVVIASFMGGMAFSRLAGDYMRARASIPRLLRISTLLSIIGMMFFSYSSSIFLVASGAAIAGIGAGNIYPLALVLANQNRDEKDAIKIISSIALVSFTAFLLAPVLMGWIGKYWSLKAAFILTIPLLALTFFWERLAR